MIFDFYFNEQDHMRRNSQQIRVKAMGDTVRYDQRFQSRITAQVQASFCTQHNYRYLEMVVHKYLTLYLELNRMC